APESCSGVLLWGPALGSCSGVLLRGPVPGSCSGAADRGGLSSPVGACRQCMAWGVVCWRGLVGWSRMLVRQTYLDPIMDTTTPSVRLPVQPSAFPPHP